METNWRGEQRTRGKFHWLHELISNAESNRISDRLCEQLLGDTVWITCKEEMGQTYLVEKQVKLRGLTV